MSKILGADLVVQALEKVGAQWAFGITGGPFAAVFHSLSNSQKIRVVLTQHETSAGYMALGSYLFSNPRRIPIVFSTSGPGATNIITGVAAAFEEKVPLFLLTGNVAKDLRHKRPAQDSFSSGTNAIHMFEPVTHATKVLDSLQDLDQLIFSLYETALQKSGPVHLNVPAHVAHEAVFRKKGGFDVTDTARAANP